MQSGVFKVISNWHIDIVSDGNSDDFDICAASVAQRWATEKYLSAVGEFVGKEVTAQVITKLVGVLFPADWAVEVFRGKIIGWIYKTVIGYFEGQTEFRSSRHALPVNQIRETKIPFVAGYRTGALLSGDLPGDLELTTYFLVGYDRESRRVSMLVISQHDGAQGLFFGDRVRAWEAKYEIDGNGLPKNPKQSLQRVDLDSIQIPSEAEQPKEEPETESNPVELKPCSKYFMPINTSVSDPKGDVPIPSIDIVRAQVKVENNIAKAEIELADLSRSIMDVSTIKEGFWEHHFWDIAFDVDGDCFIDYVLEASFYCIVPSGHLYPTKKELFCKLYRFRKVVKETTSTSDIISQRTEEFPALATLDFEKKMVKMEVRMPELKPNMQWRAIGAYKLDREGTATTDFAPNRL